MTEDYPKVQCFCGRPVGFFWGFRMKSKKSEEPGKALKALLDELNVGHVCCRTSIILSVKKHKYYIKQQSNVERRISTYDDHVLGNIYKSYVSTIDYDMGHVVKLVKDQDEDEESDEESDSDSESESDEDSDNNEE